MEIRQIDETFSGLRRYKLAGRYFSLLTAAAAVDLAFGQDGQEVSKINGAVAGTRVKVPQSKRGFTEFTITNSGSQRVVAVVSDGEVEVDVGATSITGTVTTSSTVVALPAPMNLTARDDTSVAPVGVAGILPVAARLTGYDGTNFQNLRIATVGADARDEQLMGLYVNSRLFGHNGTSVDRLRSVTHGTNIGNLQTAEQGYKYGAGFISSAQLTANTPETVVAAGSNTNGMYVFRRSIYTHASAVLRVALLAKTSAPATVVDGDPLLEIMLGSGIKALDGVQVWDRVFVAAGKGLYFISDATEATNAHRAVLYRLL